MFQTSIIARSGWLLLGAVALLALLVHYGVGPLWDLPLWAAFVLLAFVFRDPRRTIPPAPLGVVCPGDGCVVAVGAAPDPCLSRTAKHIRIKVSVLGAYTVRSPVEGKLMRQWSDAVPALGTWPPWRRNGKRFSVLIRTDEDDEVVLSIEGALLRRPHCALSTGERIGQGQRYTYLPFGALLDVWVPEAARVQVRDGDRVSAGSDVLATLIHR